MKRSQILSNDGKSPVVASVDSLMYSFLGLRGGLGLTGVRAGLPSVIRGLGGCYCLAVLLQSTVVVWCSVLLLLLVFD